MPFAPFRMGSLLVGQGRSGVGIGVGVCNFRPESESDSESLKFVDSTALLLTIQFHFHFLIKGEGMAYCPPPLGSVPAAYLVALPTLRITGGPAALPFGTHSLSHALTAARRSPTSHASTACPTFYGRRARRSPQTHDRTHATSALPPTGGLAGRLCPWL